MLSNINHYSFLDSSSSTAKGNTFQKFINLLSKDGKKSKAASLAFKTIKTIQRIHFQENTTNEDVFLFIFNAVKNVQPLFELKRLKHGATVYQIPNVLSFEKQQSIALKWLIQAAREKKKKNKRNSFEELLALEFLNAFKKQGSVFQKRNEIHKLAEANRAYIRLKWW